MGHKFKPAVIVFAVQGFLLKLLSKDNFSQDLNQSYYTGKQDIWAKSNRFYFIDSISAGVLSRNSMILMAALVYFLCSQQKSNESMILYYATGIWLICNLKIKGITSFYNRPYLFHERLLSTISITIIWL